MRNRRGFTAVEMALVTTIVGLVTMIAMPKLSSAREANELRGAKRQLITQVMAARASAVQRGRAVVLHSDGAEVWLTAVVGGVSTVISPVAKVYDQFDVTVAATHDKIAFDARGFATTLPAAGGKFVLHHGAATDSVCVTRFGTILPGCGL